MESTGSGSFLRLSNVAFLVLTSLVYRSKLPSVNVWTDSQVSKYELPSDRSFDLSSDFGYGLILCLCP